MTEAVAVLVALVLLAFGLDVPSVASASSETPSSPTKVTGSIGNTGCSYSITASWSDPTPVAGDLSGSVLCGSTASLSVTGSWESANATLKTVGGTLYGHTVSPQTVDAVISDDYDPTLDLPDFTSEFADAALVQAQSTIFKSPWTFGPRSFAGGTCSYTLQATWLGEPTSGTLAGTVACGTAASITLTADWDGTSSFDVSETKVSFGSVTGTIAGVALPSGAITQSIDVPVGGADDLEGLVDGFAQQVPEALGEWLVSNGPQSLLDAFPNPSQIAASGDTVGGILKNLDSLCQQTLKYEDPVPDCQLPLINEPAGDTEDPPSNATPGLDSMDDSQGGACPELANNPPPKLFVVCVPVGLAGSFDAGDKSVIVVPGGAILAAPVGASLGSATTPTITTKGSILVLGGAIEGVNLSMTAAKDVEFAGADVSMLGSLSISAGGALSIGEVGTKDALGFVPSLLNDKVDTQTGDTGTGANGIAGLFATALPATTTLPAQLWASRITVKAGAMTVSSGGSISADGLGQAGAAFYGHAIYTSGPYTGAVAGGGGAYANYGGSHIGYGGWPVDAPIWTDKTYGPGPRGPTFDSPYQPHEPGGGGGGGYDFSEGFPGGGVITINSSSLDLAGQLLADGDSDTQEHCGGDGAGGAINITTGTFSGHGTVHANGGGSPEDSCEFGGFGGGGALAIHYTSDTFTGSEHAHGGLLPVTKEPGLSKDFGGAGTVFLQDTTVAKPAKPATETSGGTLIIDGDQQDSYRPTSESTDVWPTEDGTPLPDGWSNKSVELEITGDAHVYATNPTFGKIVIASDGVLSAAPLAKRLVVSAEAITIEKSGRIDMSGHGYAGGTDADGAFGIATSPPGTTPAEANHGGSHGGAGGTDIARPKGNAGSTYDNPMDPVLPGGGGGGGYGDDDNRGSYGGGVLQIIAQQLTNDGVISADGQDEDGPTIAFPVLGQTEGASAGAGGSVQVHVQTLIGNGPIEADGGSLNLPPSAGIGQPDAGGFSQQDGSNGAGGGGDVLLVASASRSFTGPVTAAGGVNVTNRTSGGHAGHVVRVLGTPVPVAKRARVRTVSRHRSGTRGPRSAAVRN
jgi:hypothetical protein